MSDKKIELRCLNSLAKVIAHRELDSRYFLERATTFSNEIFSFQVAYRSEQLVKGIRVTIESLLSDSITVRKVGLVPSELACYGDHDDDVISDQPGLYPDPLMPLDVHGEVALPGSWSSLWITVELKNQHLEGVYPIDVILLSADGNRMGSERIDLQVLSGSLPKQKLIRTEWFHTDCLANHYHVNVFSEEHWALIEQYVQTAVKQGINMILTPLFTPPLDTEVGGERTTVQLVEVQRDENGYRFDFRLLERWIALGDRCGVQYFEFSHLFTQWGAQFAPKIMAAEKGQLKRIFGWETDATGEGYGQFLEALLPELDRFIKKLGIQDRVFFHVSDEPTLDNLESYRAASTRLSQFLQGYPTFDALSDYEFYGHGLVNTPVVANNHIDAFISRGVDNLWTYYCCAQYKKVSNRFFAFPSERNRIIGFQLYKFDIRGFLHWGYNFWYSQYARKMVNPFVQTDADRAFPSGDAFLVYPGETGPIESIRMVVFYEALQDVRALEMLEGLIGRERTIALIEEDLELPLTFSDYPHEPDWIIKKREKINQLIASLA
ncbi:DUF4091 domain-containing protein [Paenibacillus alginolyticus]|uniref:DUF4091 domain-containing protein n=2 Tax=Paenibacillus alginolyticus TaxID=59839 RepID=A0ABT4G9H4_9BACL|nr:DUF4091 domain-containing protein [Paenibacillus alginolyticus]MCY9692837.1 DUF4091 domain-containing protein [Paenibacillus alginolyticus]MEC0142894.1 DUF4091 domain-containing protein [Paenibacillus alginolyticus]